MKTEKSTQRETWRCEECGEEQTIEPSYCESHVGYDETIKLWFCNKCSN